MREILFKAKRKDNGKWVEGYYQKRYDLLGNEEHLIFHADSYTVWEYAEIDPETLCEFTGRCDKSGNKIWENDILMAHLDELYPEDVTYETIEWGVAGWVTHEANSVDIFSDQGNASNTSISVEKTPQNTSMRSWHYIRTVSC